MTDLLYLFGGSIALVAMLASIAIRSGYGLRHKVGALAIAGLFLPLFYLTLLGLLGRPKPTMLEWNLQRSADAVVLATQLREDKAIYLWLQVPDLQEPRSYALPWDRELAQQIQAAQREAESNGTPVRVTGPLSATPDDDQDAPLFYAPAQQPPPRKEVSTQEPLIYNPSETTGLQHRTQG